MSSWERFNESYTLKNLNPVFAELFNLHQDKESSIQVTYKFSQEAQLEMNKVHDWIVNGYRASESSAMIQDSSDSESESETDTEPPVIHSYLGTKYSDQLGRLAVSLHCFSSVLSQMLGKMNTCIIPEEITTTTLLAAKKLLDHLLR